MRLDEARTQASVVGRQLEEARAQRDVLVEQVSEGAVLAPVSGRVLRVPITVGAVVLPGEAIAEVALENYVLRLALPERHARFMAEGDEVRVDESALGGGAPRTARIVQVYPHIADGRVIADATVEGLGDFFVGLQEVSLRIVDWAMMLAPLAVFSLICQVVMRVGLDAVLGRTAYMASVLIGLLLLVVFYLILGVPVVILSLIQLSGVRFHIPDRRRRDLWMPDNIVNKAR